MPVFRDEAGAFLGEPYRAAFLTAPAVNRGALRGGSKGRAGEVRAEMGRRIHKVLRIAAAHGHEALVLGAWGCGVFRNDPAEVATLFAAELRGEAGRWFARVVFAVFDTTRDQRVRRAFEAALVG